MAEAVLYNIAARIIWELGSSILDEIWLLWGVKDELDKLKTTVSTIQAVLLHAEELSVENPDVKSWLGKLSEAMYVADDLLDDFSTEALSHQVMAGPKAAKEVRLFFSSSNQFAFGLKMAHKIKAARDKLDEIDANRKKFNLNERLVERAFVGPARNQTHSSPPQVVVGRKVEKEAIIKDLLSSDDGQENVSVVSIVGFGGLGKTTLAQLVYKDLDEGPFKNHFELKMWVSVSVDFDVKLLVKKVLESATKQTPQNTQMDTLKNLLHEKINGRKYLMVLDDVWNEDVSKWISFKDLLAGGARGSKIVITTRLLNVAQMSQSIHIHELKDLPKEEAWSLFKKMALKSGQVLSPTHEVTGKEIVSKCCGVPLAIRAIGAMLRDKDLDSEWEWFKNKELSKINVYKNGILPILKLSYNYLPSRFKHCFAYCSLYPKDFTISVEELIHQWKAHGFLMSTDSDSDQCLQEVGFGCFMDLYRLSFFQDVEKDEFGNIKSCKMHDLMHDLAISVAGNKFSSTLVDIKDQTQHMSFWVDQNSTLQDFSPLLKAKSIRTVLPFSGYASRQVIIKEKTLDDLFYNLRCLRALSLSALNISKLPSSIYKLKHLRHLDLSRNHDLKKLPDPITNLLNLLVLNLSWCSGLEQLPDNITKLVNLTDLDNEGCDRLTHMPRRIGKLTRLEKLPVFAIANHNSTFSKHSGGLNELQGLNNLRGELVIKNLKYVKKAGFEFKEAILSEKKQLQELTLRWKAYDNWSADDVGNDEMVLEALRPHQNLKRLTVEYYRGVRPPSWLPSTTNLVSFSIKTCRNIKWLPSLDQFPYLKKLLVTGSSKLERIDVEMRGSSSVFFPSLEKLTLEKCPNLKGFERCNKTSDVGSLLSTEELPTCFPRLSQLGIVGCPSLTCMPSFPELKKLQLGGDGVKSLMDVMKMRTTSSASESTSSPFSTLSQLEHLIIWRIEDCAMVDELVQYLPSLQKLQFLDCTCKIVSSDEKDDGMQWKNLKVLQYVEFDRMENLVCLPKGLQYVTTLQRLHIECCHSMGCIPEWMGKLTALQGLRITDCRQLSERCKNNTAEDWPNICHIPNINIDFESIQRNGCYLL